MAADNGVPEARRPKLPVGARRALARKASRRACPPRSVLPRTRNSACRPRNTEYAVNGSHPCPATGVRFGYGFAMFGDRFTGAPEIALGPSQAGRDYSLGWWMVDAGTGTGPVALMLEARRRATANEDALPEHGVGFRLTVRW